MVAFREIGLFLLPPDGTRRGRDFFIDRDHARLEFLNSIRLAGLQVHRFTDVR